MAYTYRMKYSDEYKVLSVSYQKALKAYDDLIEGKITSYSLGNRSVTRSQADLKTLMDFIESTRNRLSELEAILRGDSIRSTTRFTYADPAYSYWYKRGL